jgi:CRISPR-associated protein Cas5h
MEVISLDIGGKFAHFRKYYANNTALSYTIPPRTTIMGMLAALLGRERDSYYEEISSEHLRIGIRIMTPLKKSFHRLNLLSIKSSDDFSGKGGRIQTPFEVVTGYNISTDWVIYRLFLSPTDTGKAVFKELADILTQRKQHYALTLGTANFSASILQVQDYKQIQSTQSDNFVPIHSAVVSDSIEQLNFEKYSEGGYNFLEEEMMPADFVANHNREVRKMVRMLYSTQSTAFEVKLRIPYYILTTPAETQHIVFLE